MTDSLARDGVYLADDGATVSVLVTYSPGSMDVPFSRDDVIDLVAWCNRWLAKEETE